MVWAEMNQSSHCEVFKNLKSQLLHMSTDEVASHHLGPGTRRNAERKRKYSVVRTEMVNLRLHSNLVKLRTIANQYKLHYGDAYAVENEADPPVPSTATISRILAKSDVVRKVVS